MKKAVAKKSSVKKAAKPVATARKPVKKVAAKPAPKSAPKAATPAPAPKKAKAPPAAPDDTMLPDAKVLAKAFGGNHDDEGATIIDKPAPVETAKAVKTMGEPVKVEDVEAGAGGDGIVATQEQPRRFMRRTYLRQGKAGGGIVTNSGQRQIAVTFTPSQFDIVRKGAMDRQVSFSEMVRQCVGAFFQIEPRKS